jgi:RNA polymerase sigma factor (sigma-70 family)
VKKLTLGQIIDGIRRRDNNTLAQIYKEIFPVVRYFVKNNGGSPDDAQDVFQESLIIIYKQINDNKLDIKSGFEAYVYGISRMVWLKILRNRDIHNRNVNYYETETISYQISEESVEEELELRLFRKHFSKLGEECQKFLKLVTEGISYDEIAKKMGYKSEKIVRNKKYKCKETLIKMIKDDPEYQQMIRNK